jgi:ATP-dependent protease ClpP protease subunit
MKFFDCMEERTKEYVLERTKMTEEFYDKIYEQEYWMYADEAKDLGVVDKIIGVDCTFDDIL